VNVWQWLLAAGILGGAFTAIVLNSIKTPARQRRALHWQLRYRR
jgi:xanthine/uracil permease